MSIKTLSTEQQQELQALLETLKEVSSYLVDNVELNAAINYWALELKPNRVRKKTSDSTNIVDNTVEV